MGKVPVVEMLLQAGARASPHDDYGETPLHLAALLGHYGEDRLSQNAEGLRGKPKRRA